MEDGPRASDAERERVVTALQRHFADGRLNGDEFADRVERALAARTLGELYAVTSDLPVLPVVDVPHRPVQVSTSRRRRWWRS